MVQALKNKVMMYTFNGDISYDLNENWITNKKNRTKNDIYQLFEYKNDIKLLINHSLEKHQNIKCGLSIHCKFAFGDNIFDVSLATKYEKILNNNFDDIIDNQIHNLVEKINEFEGRGSGLVLKAIKKLIVNVVRYDPNRPRSYIKLPEHIANKKCCINIQNNDNKCFEYCILYHEHKNILKVHPEKISQYKKLNSIYKFDNLEYPLKPDDIDKFEK